MCATAGSGKCDTGSCKDKFGLDSSSTCSICKSQGAGKCDG